MLASAEGVGGRSNRSGPMGALDSLGMQLQKRHAHGRTITHCLTLQAAIAIKYDFIAAFSCRCRVFPCCPCRAAEHLNDRNFASVPSSACAVILTCFQHQDCTFCLQIQTVTLRLRQTQQSRTRAGPGPGLLAEVAGEGAKAGVAEVVVEVEVDQSRTRAG